MVVGQPKRQPRERSQRDALATCRSVRSIEHMAGPLAVGSVVYRLTALLVKPQANRYQR
jgi:hypothetical protein